MWEVLVDECAQEGSLSGVRRTVLLLGVPVDDVTLDEAVDVVVALAADGRATSRTHQVATVNVDFVVNALADESLRAVLATTSLSIPDGMPIVWSSRVLGAPLRTRVSGADLVPAIAARAGRDGATIALFGAGPGIARKAAEVLRELAPAATIVGLDAPAFTDPAELDAGDLEPLRAVGASICCVAFGNPKQERFIEHWGHRLGIPVMIGVGGSLDFIAGEKRRAPAWMQRTGLEWLHRAITEPRRLVRRYARDFVAFGPPMVRQAWRGRRSSRRGRLGVADLPDGRLLLDLTHLQAADNETAATITSLVRDARVRGREVEIRGEIGPASGGVEGLDRIVRTAAAGTEGSGHLR